MRYLRFNLWHNSLIVSWTGFPLSTVSTGGAVFPSPASHGESQTNLGIGKPIFWRGIPPSSDYLFVWKVHRCTWKWHPRHMNPQVWSDGVFGGFFGLHNFETTNNHWNRCLLRTLWNRMEKAWNHHQKKIVEPHTDLIIYQLLKHMEIIRSFPHVRPVEGYIQTSDETAGDRNSRMDLKFRRKFKKKKNWQDSATSNFDLGDKSDPQMIMDKVYIAFLPFLDTYLSLMSSEYGSLSYLWRSLLTSFWWNILQTLEVKVTLFHPLRSCLHERPSDPGAPSSIWKSQMDTKKRLVFQQNFRTRKYVTFI